MYLSIKITNVGKYRLRLYTLHTYTVYTVIYYGNYRQVRTVPVVYLKIKTATNVSECKIVNQLRMRSSSSERHHHGSCSNSLGSVALL